MSLSNATLKEWDEEEECIKPVKNDAIDFVDTEKDYLELNLDHDPVSVLRIPMTPSNIQVLKEQIRLSDHTLQKESDNRGRVNLGVDHGDKEVELTILEENDIDGEE